MNLILLSYLFLPLIAWLLIFGFAKNERHVAKITTIANWLLTFNLVALFAAWAYKHHFQDYEFTWFTLISREDYQFPILFFLDHIAAVFLFCIFFIFSIITRYCRYYLHREAGYRRFFLTIFGFLFGINLVVLSGSIDLLFAGWEIVGLSSFLLIAFYRERLQPVRNAYRAYTVYRFCDIGLLLGAWMTHLMFHGSQHFSHLQRGDATLIEAMSHIDFSMSVLLSILIVIAASGKSAQFPFCFWLPRAMEGPTPSSAIFYGALSVHLGVFLLMRTSPIWSYHFATSAIVFSVGLLTVIITSLTMRVQSNIKAQIGYASITQVGLMFIELALGLETLALIHFMGNAFLRCYQLLVSPSIVAHLLRVEGAADTQFEIMSRPFFGSLLKLLPAKTRSKMMDTLYVFALQEGNLDRLVKSILWTPLKKLGYLTGLFTHQWLRIFAVILVLGLVGIKLSTANLPYIEYAFVITSILMIIVSLASFSDKYDVFRVWNASAFSTTMAGLTIWFLQDTSLPDVLLFLSGILPAWLLGSFSIIKLTQRLAKPINFYQFHGMYESQPTYALLLLIAFLGLSGFPISSAFLGEDLLLHHASQEHLWASGLITFAFVINGITLARVFITLCLGNGTWRPIIEE